MKIQLDYDNSIITIEDRTPLGEFFNKVTHLIPDWEEWKVSSMTYLSNWGTPLQVYPYRPWYYSTVRDFTSDTSGSIDISTGSMYIESKKDKVPTSISGIINLQV